MQPISLNPKHNFMKGLPVYIEQGRGSNQPTMGQLCMLRNFHDPLVIPSEWQIYLLRLSADDTMQVKSLVRRRGQKYFNIALGLQNK